MQYILRSIVDYINFILENISNGTQANPQKTSKASTDCQQQSGKFYFHCTLPSTNMIFFLRQTQNVYASSISLFGVQIENGLFGRRRPDTAARSVYCRADATVNIILCFSHIIGFHTVFEVSIGLI